MKMRNLGALLFLPLLVMTTPCAAVEKISLHALFKDKAILMVDGARRVVKTGDSTPEGVKLITTNTQEEKADVEINGKRQELKLGMVGAGFAPVGKGSVVLYPDRGGHFVADGYLNGVAAKLLVDTGATVVAMNSNVAKRLGIDYRRGQAGVANTAGGMVRSYHVTLDSVQIGDIKAFSVEASVVEGSHPTEVLLGMSFLGRLDMRRDADKMELKER
jgi:aspartyl protease family protein